MACRFTLTQRVLPQGVNRLSCICYLSKTHFVRDFLQNSIGNSSTSTTCNPICSEGTILNGILSTTNARNTGDTPFIMRNRSENDPRMIRPHTRPSRNRRTAEVDHRGSGTDFVWKNIGFRASATLKNAFRARLPSKLHRQLLHQHHLQSHLQ